MGFVNFHGMVCSPKTASRCINEFDGVVLFMPSTYTPETLASFDCKGALNYFSYYLLVVLSLTGLSTLLGMTDIRMAKDYPATTRSIEATQAPLASELNPALRVEPFVLDYCKQYTEANAMYLKRQFEYKFRLVGLEVIMLHFRCDQNKLHLVEVYQFNSRMWQDYVAPFCMSFAKAFRDFVVSRQKRRENTKKDG